MKRTRKVGTPKRGKGEMQGSGLAIQRAQAGDVEHLTGLDYGTTVRLVEKGGAHLS